MMNFRVLLFFFLILLFTFSLSGPVLAQGEDEGDDEKEDPWGDAAIDHDLNVDWDYPSDYTHRPLNFSKRLVLFGIEYSQMSSKHYWDDDGELVEGSFRTRKQVFDLFFGGGITKNWSAKVTFPMVYKKTKIFKGNQNYRLGRSNTYGYLVEEAFVDFLDNHEIWKLWEADLPQLGDIRLWTGYSLVRILEPRTTSLILELDVKFPTGNDNTRRSQTIQNYINSGNTDSLVGLGFKQEFWRFAWELHGGYNIRWKANTKYSDGSVDLGDQIKAKTELAFQFWEVQPFWQTMNLIAGVNYMGRYDIPLKIGGRKPMFTYIKDNSGNERQIEDAPASSLSVEPKLLLQNPLDIAGLNWLTRHFNDVYFAADIPIMGQRSFLVSTGSLYVPPWELETYEGVGITYKFGVVKRWQ